MARKTSTGKKPQNATGLCVRLLIVARGHTVSSVARSCGISQSYLSMILSGERKSQAIEKKLTRIFKLAPGFFNGGRDAISNAQRFKNIGN